MTNRYYFVVGAKDASKSLMILSGGTVRTMASSPLVIIGSNTEGALVVTNTGTMIASGPVVVSGSSVGSLDVVDGGTVNAKGIYIGGAYQSATGTVNLATGGNIELSASVTNSYGVGMGTFNFNGGTLKASASCTLIVSHNKLTVNVLANGGVIDNGGNDIAIDKGMVGEGGITLRGSGTTTFSVDQGYAGATTVKDGTTISAIGRTFAGPVVFESGANVVAPVVPEGEGFVVVMTAASFTGVDLLPKVGSKSFFVKGNRLMFGNSAGFGMIVR